MTFSLDTCCCNFSVNVMKKNKSTGAKILKMLQEIVLI